MNIVSLSMTPFAEGFCSRQGLNIAFSKHCGTQYFWIEPQSGGQRWTRHLTRGRRSRAGRDLVLYRAPGWLPVLHWRPGLERWMRAGRIRAFRRALVKKWSRPRVLYIWDPHFVDYIQGLEPDLVCYHIYDNQRAFVDESGRDALIERETRLLQTADVIVTCSRCLADFHGVLERAVYCPAAVDSSFFVRAAKARRHRPTDLPADRPIIGYAGAINAKIDLDVLEEVARRDPHWRVVLLGWLELKGNDLDRFRQLQDEGRLCYLGVKPWRDMIRYVANFDVGMLCYKAAEWSRFCELPLKLFEYLGAGKPVVGGGLPHLSSFDGMVQMSAGPEEFADNVARALAEDSEEQRQKRVAVASENTWDARAEAVMAAIGRALASRQSGRTVACQAGGGRSPEPEDRAEPATDDMTVV